MTSNPAVAPPTPPRPELPEPMTVRPGPWFWLRQAVLLLGRFIRGYLRWQGSVLTVVVFAPGAVALMGVRVWVARLCGVDHHASLRRWPSDVGSASDDALASTPWRRVAVRLVPHAVLLVIGALLLGPALVRFQLLSTSPLPTLTRDPGLLLRGDDVLPANAVDLVLVGLVDLAVVWAGVSAWFWATPTLDLLRASRADLAVAANAGSHRIAARVVRAILGPPQAVLYVLRPVDEVATWTGLNVLIGTNGIALASMVGAGLLGLSSLNG
jgi:hypothetical protein